LRIRRNIYLIGFMGTGKSTIGRELARFLGKKFVDMDNLLQKRMGMTVSQIFEKHGEQFFREQELEVAKELAAQTGRVIATGGGSILNPKVRDIFCNNGLMICLFTDRDQLLQRLKRTDRRPLLRGSEEVIEEKVDKLIEERKNAYQCSSIRVNTTNMTPQEVAKKIIDTLKTYKRILDKLHDQYIVIS